MKDFQEVRAEKVIANLGGTSFLTETGKVIEGNYKVGDYAPVIYDRTSLRFLPAWKKEISGKEIVREDEVEVSGPAIKKIPQPYKVWSELMNYRIYFETNDKDGENRYIDVSDIIESGQGSVSFEKIAPVEYNVKYGVIVYTVRSGIDIKAYILKYHLTEKREEYIIYFGVKYYKYDFDYVKIGPINLGSGSAYPYDGCIDLTGVVYGHDYFPQLGYRSLASCFFNLTVNCTGGPECWAYNPATWRSGPPQPYVFNSVGYESTPYGTGDCGRWTWAYGSCGTPFTPYGTFYCYSFFETIMDTVTPLDDCYHYYPSVSFAGISVMMDDDIDDDNLGDKIRCRFLFLCYACCSFRLCSDGRHWIQVTGCSSACNKSSVVPKDCWSAGLEMHVPYLVEVHDNGDCNLIDVFGIEGAEIALLPKTNYMPFNNLYNTKYFNMVAIDLEGFDPIQEQRGNGYIITTNLVTPFLYTDIPNVYVRGFPVYERDDNGKYQFYGWVFGMRLFVTESLYYQLAVLWKGEKKSVYASTYDNFYPFYNEGGGLLERFSYGDLTRKIYCIDNNFVVNPTLEDPYVFGPADREFLIAYDKLKLDHVPVLDVEYYRFEDLIVYRFKEKTFGEMTYSKKPTSTDTVGFGFDVREVRITG